MLFCLSEPCACWLVVFLESIGIISCLVAPRYTTFLPTKNGSLSLTLVLHHSFSHWSLQACHLLSLFLCLSLSLYSKFVDMTINAAMLNTLDNMDTETIPLSVFVFVDSLVVCASQDVGGYAQITSSCIWAVDWVILHWYACCMDRRKGRRMVMWLPKFLGWVDYHIFLGMGLCLRALRVCGAQV